MTSTTLPDTVRTRAFIDGEFTDALDRATFDSLAPATGGVIAEIAACGEADVDRAVGAARAAFTRGDWSQMAPADRKSVLLRFADLIEAHVEELALVEAIDAGKPIADCRGFDLPDVLGTIRWYAETADKVFGKTSPTDADHLGLIVREPVGVVGGVLPWNFPLAMLAWKIGPALATGNSVVIKPPELASLTTLRVAELALEAGLPRGVFNVVPGLGHVTGRALGLHPDVDMITFTGFDRGRPRVPALLRRIQPQGHGAGDGRQEPADRDGRLPGQARYGRGRPRQRGFLGRRAELQRRLADPRPLLDQG